MLSKMQLRTTGNQVHRRKQSAVDVQGFLQTYLIATCQKQDSLRDNIVVILTVHRR